MNSPPHPPNDGGAAVAALLDAVVHKRPGADAALLEAVYGELRAIASAYFRALAPGNTMQPTALVHEAYLKIMGSSGNSAESRAHFIALAATAMRQIIIDHARRQRALKRGGDASTVTLSGIALESGVPDPDAVDVHEALNRLARIDERQARVVELRFFAGLNVAETALVLGVSDRTVEFDWRLARAWLRRELGEQCP